MYTIDLSFNTEYSFYSLMLGCSTEQQTQYLQVWKLETGSSAVCEYNRILL